MEIAASTTTTPSSDQIDDQRDSEHLFQPYATLIRTDLHCPIINWLDRHMSIRDGGFEPKWALGVRMVMTRGNSKVRKLASEALANLHSLGLFRDGDAWVRRIAWGDLLKLGDCAFQHVAIGQLHFCAVDFGDSIHLDEFHQRKLVSPDRLERNQCTSTAVADGVIARSSSTSSLHARSRVIQTALGPRIAEWKIACPRVSTDGEARPFDERTLLILCRDIAQPGRDRDYRSLCKFLDAVREDQHLTIRIFDVL